MHKLHLPRLGQTMKQGAIVEWFKKEGEPYEAGDVLYEFESEKVTFQVEGKRPGSIARIVAPVQEVLPVGALLAVVADPGESLSASEIEAAISEEQAKMTPAEAAAPSATAPEARTQVSRAATTGRVQAVPKARALAKELGVNLSEVTGSGKSGAITVGDVEAAALAQGEGMPRIRERRQVIGIARSMADAVTRSWTQIPQFVQMIWVDGRGLQERRLKEGPAIKQSHDVNISVNDLIIYAVVGAVEEVPEVNATFEGDEIVLYEDVNVSVAIATDAGLIVPVIHETQNLSLGDLAVSIRALAERARLGSLTSKHVQGGTITVSNLGMFGVETGTPIITPPQAAIVFIGAIEDKVVVRDGSIQVDPRMGVAIAYDHRVLSGVTAARFTAAVKRRLESGPGMTEESKEKTPSAETKKVSTLAKKLAERKGVSLDDVVGTGVRGRIMQADVMAAAERGGYGAPEWDASMEQAIRSVAQTLVDFPQLKAVIRKDGIYLGSE